MIHYSPLPDVEIPDLPLTEYVLAGGAGQPDKPALIDGASGWVMTYGELESAIRSLAGGLAATGFGRGDVLALMAPNSPEYAVVFHGAAMAGGTVTTINPAYTQAEVHHQLTDSGARILVTVPPLAATAVRASAGTGITEIYLLGETGEADGADGTLPVRPLRALAGSPLAAHVPVGPDDVVALPCSSGTTGLAKGVMLTHRNLVANVAQTLGAIPSASDERLMAVLPFFHIYGMQCMMNCGLRAGATVVTLPRFDLEQFLRAHQDYQITRSFVAPPIVLALARHPMVDKFDLSQLRLVNSGAAPLKAELAAEASKRLGCEVIQGYGMTELSPVSHLTPPGWFKPGSVGSPPRAPDPDRRPGDGHRSRHRGGGGGLGARAAGDGGVPEQPPGHGGDRRRGRVAAYRRPGLHGRGRAPVRGGPAEGAHQVQGVPGAPGRA